MAHRPRFARLAANNPGLIPTWNVKREAWNVERATLPGRSPTWDLSEPNELDEPLRAIFAATPGLPTLSLLYVGLGPERALWLPGLMGNFALTHDQLAELAHAVRHAHALPPVERAAAVERMYSLLKAGNAHGFPVAHLLTGLPDLIGSALGRGLGLVGATMTG